MWHNKFVDVGADAIATLTPQRVRDFIGPFMLLVDRKLSVVLRCLLEQADDAGSGISETAQAELVPMVELTSSWRSWLYY